MGGGAQALALSKQCMLVADPAEPRTTFTGLHDEMLFKCHYQVTLFIFPFFDLIWTFAASLLFYIIFIRVIILTANF